MLLMPGRFHDAVERHELRCDQPSHRILRTLLDRLHGKELPSTQWASVQSIATDPTCLIGPSSSWGPGLVRCRPGRPRRNLPPIAGQMKLRERVECRDVSAASLTRGTASQPRIGGWSSSSSPKFHWPSTRPTLQGIVPVSWAVTTVLSRGLHCPPSEQLDPMVAGGPASQTVLLLARRRAARGSPAGMRPVPGRA